MQKLTATMLAAPDVHIKMTLYQWAALPEDYRLELEPHCLGESAEFIFFRVPEYKATDLLTAYEMQLGDKK